MKNIFSITSADNWYDQKPSSEASFTVTSMFKLLRSTDTAKSPQSSHVAVLSPKGLSCNWFTATPNPQESVFKPFIFTSGARISPLTQVPEGGDLPLLHKLHSQRKWEIVGSLLQSLEVTCVEEMDRYLNEHSGVENQELFDLMKDCVEAEVKFYR